MPTFSKPILRGCSMFDGRKGCLEMQRADPRKTIIRFWEGSGAVNVLLPPRPAPCALGGGGAGRRGIIPPQTFGGDSSIVLDLLLPGQTCWTRNYSKATSNDGGRGDYTSWRTAECNAANAAEARGLQVKVMTNILFLPPTGGRRDGVAERSRRHKLREVKIVDARRGRFHYWSKQGVIIAIKTSCFSASSLQWPWCLSWQRTTCQIIRFSDVRIGRSHSQMASSRCEKWPTHAHSTVRRTAMDWSELDQGDICDDCIFGLEEGGHGTGASSHHTNGTR